MEPRSCGFRPTPQSAQEMASRDAGVPTDLAEGSASRCLLRGLPGTCNNADCSFEGGRVSRTFCQNSPAHCPQLKFPPSLIPAGTPSACVKTVRYQLHGRKCWKRRGQRGERSQSAAPPASPACPSRRPPPSACRLRAAPAGSDPQRSGPVFGPPSAQRRLRDSLSCGPCGALARFHCRVMSPRSPGGERGCRRGSSRLRHEASVKVPKPRGLGTSGWRAQPCARRVGQPTSAGTEAPAPGPQSPPRPPGRSLRPPVPHASA